MLEKLSEMNYRQLLKAGGQFLYEGGNDEAESDAWLLFEKVFQLNRVSLLMKGDHRPDDREMVSRYMDYLRRRRGGEPVQYILNEAWFMGLPFYVDPDVLIPRFDTEVLAEKTLEIMQAGDRVLDMCTGSGCIILSLAKYGKMSGGVGADLSEGALRVSEKNKAALGIENVTFLRSDLFENIHETYDIIVSNPPYIPTKVIEELKSEVKDHEPRMALDGTEDGLLFYRAFAREAMDHLRDGGHLLVEIGYDQGESVSALLIQGGFKDVKVYKDLAGLDRVVSGRK